MLIRHVAMLKKQLSGSGGFEAGKSEGSDMELIHNQALLMTAGGITFNAIYSGEMSAILAALVHMGHAALGAAVCGQQAFPELAPATGLTYQMLAIMRRLSEKIDACSSGSIESYVELYHYCSALATDFLNADFNTAFERYHHWRVDCAGLIIHQLNNLPDLSDCLYE